jgi:hypothetical protein
MRKFFLAILLQAAAWAFPAHALTSLPLYLDELIDRSAVAFEGTCVSNRTERDALSGLVVTYTTFAVHDALKGSPESTHVIKQVGGTLPDESFTYRVHGVPTFNVGEDYVVFLAGVSAAGFSSPMGLGQGRFTVRSTPHGLEASNGRDFKDLAARLVDKMPERARAHLLESAGAVTAIDIDDFKDTVRNHVRSSR